MLNAQEVEYHLDFNGVQLESVIDFMENEYGLLFSYKTEDVAGKGSTVHIRNENLREVLSALFVPLSIDFEIVNEKYILLRQMHSKTSIDICGAVYDSVTELPLEFATVVASENGKGTITDENGQFCLNLTEPLSGFIVVSYVGYEVEKISIDNWDEGSHLKVDLKYPEYLEPYVVVTDYLSDGVIIADNGMATKVDLGRVDAIAGSVESDVFAFAQALPGISSPSSRASDINIRGTTPDQTLISWEGIPVYHAAHYFGMISAINGHVIDEMDIYRGGFGAEYGGRVGGIINLSSDVKMGASEKMGVGANMTHAYIYGNQYLDRKKKTRMTFSLRRSFHELINTPTYDNITKVNQQGLLIGNKEVSALPDHIRVQNDFDFVDAHLKLATQISSKDQLSLSVIFADNNFTDQISDNKKLESQGDTMKLENLGLGLNWRRTWTDRIFSEVGLVSTTYKYDYNYDLRREDELNPLLVGLKKNEILDQQVKVTTSYISPKEQVVELGYNLINYDISYGVIEKSNPSQDVDDAASTTGGHHSLFVNFKNPIDNVIGCNVGLRSSYFDVNGKLYLEPRLQFSYQLEEDLSLSLYAGRHHQFVGQVSVFRGNDNGINTALWALSEDKSIPVQRADVLQMGIIYEKQGWVLDVQGYLKELDGLSSRAYDFEDAMDGNPLIGSANVMGLDIMIKKRYRKWRSWLSYSVSKNDLSFKRLSIIDFPSDFDQRHVLSFNNQIDVYPFRLALGLNYASGLPYTVMESFQRTSKPNEPFEYTANYGPINGERLSANTEINISAQYKFEPKNQNWTGEVSFSVTNLLDAENLFSRTYDVDSPKNQTPFIDILDKRNLPFTPNVGLRIFW